MENHKKTLDKIIRSLFCEAEGCLTAFGLMKDKQDIRLGTVDLKSATKLSVNELAVLEAVIATIYRTLEPHEEYIMKDAKKYPNSNYLTLKETAKYFTKKRDTCVESIKHESV